MPVKRQWQYHLASARLYSPQRACEYDNICAVHAHGNAARQGLSHVRFLAAALLAVDCEGVWLPPRSRLCRPSEAAYRCAKMSK